MGGGCADIQNELIISGSIASAKQSQLKCHIQNIQFRMRKINGFFLYKKINEYNHTAYLHKEQTENTSMFVL